MNYEELSVENVKEKSKTLYNEIKNSNYNYDLVIFIAKGSYLIGHELSKLNNVPLLEIFATRSGGKLKNIIKPILKLVPKKILIKLRTKEMNSNFHEKKNDRKISYNEKEYEKYINCKKILLVDDSIDSGNSVILAKSTIESIFENAEVRVAVFNVMDKSQIKPDFCLYTNCMICGPWSNDSKENNVNLKLYNNWKINR